MVRSSDVNCKAVILTIYIYFLLRHIFFFSIQVKRYSRVITSKDDHRYVGMFRISNSLTFFTLSFSGIKKIKINRYIYSLRYSNKNNKVINERYGESG